MPPPFKVKAVYEYKSDEPDDLNFQNGQIISVTEDDDDDWYTGEYVDESGQRREGIFPRNFVEKYEPAIPARPAKGARKSVLLEGPQPVAAESSPAGRNTLQQEVINEAETEPTSAAATASEPVPARAQAASSKPVQPAAKLPPPVAEKPSNSSFKDRIAAFNKPAAAPITPFKPAGGSNSSTSFIKKPFVAPPPSRNAYIPPPTQPPAPKVYRREEDPDLARDIDEQVLQQEDTLRAAPTLDEDQPKPTSLKDRIALLHQQQLEQAQRNAEKKKAPKKPSVRRTDSQGPAEELPDDTAVPIKRHDTGDTLGRRSVDVPRVLPQAPEVANADGEQGADPTAIPAPSRELVSDTNDADDSGAGETEVDTSAEEERTPPVPPTAPPPISRTPAQRENIEEADAEEEESETEEEEDPEIRRRRELRDRMAKMSGGMGMMGMFGGGMPAPAKRSKPTREAEARYDEGVPQQEPSRAPPVPVMALPGISVPVQRPSESGNDGDEEDEPASPTPIEPSRAMAEPTMDYMSLPKRTSTQKSFHLTQEDSVIPLPPNETRPGPARMDASRSPPVRPVPPPPPPTTRSTLHEADPVDETVHPAMPPRKSLEQQVSARLSSAPGIPPPPPTRPPATTDYSDNEEPAPTSSDKRVSRAPPPQIPGPPSAAPARAPPPPPPGQPLTRTGTTASRVSTTGPRTGNAEDEDDVEDYDGDYDTDIASSAKHKDALKAHNRGSSLDDEGTLTDDAAKTTSPPARAAPPLPAAAAPRDMPPPLPQSGPKARTSVDAPRAVPPPVPTQRPDDDEYDPYRYSAPRHGVPSPPISAPQAPILERAVPAPATEEDDTYPLPPAGNRQVPPSHISSQLADRAVPGPPLNERFEATTVSVAAAAGPKGVPVESYRQSTEISRMPTTRRSTELSRHSLDYGFMATDVDLGESSGWWTHDNSPPPSIQGRNDVLYEIESSASTRRGGKTTVTREVYVLYKDYSQTTINVSFDPADPAHASISQSHERPPSAPRQDQLESASDTFGSQLCKAAAAAADKVVGDGSAHMLVSELLRPLQSTALMPVGTRAYGALVYANMGNASIQQFDEIRPGDVVSFRNAKFLGHKGGLHSKYSLEAGKPDHVGIVIDWDGTKKKIRAWEQGREEKGKKAKVREESYRVGDLKSGELRVWRVMPRSWVAWDKS